MNSQKITYRLTPNNLGEEVLQAVIIPSAAINQRPPAGRKEKEMKNDNRNLNRNLNTHPMGRSGSLPHRQILNKQRKNSGLKYRNLIELLCFLIVFGLFANISTAQTTKNTEYKADQALKSNARVNPSTLAMELSIPIGGYPGRAGNNQPIAFDYSSKVWRLEAGGSFMGPIHEVTNTSPFYADKNAAGWTSSLRFPSVDETLRIYYNDPTRGAGIPIDDGAPYPSELYWVKRIYVTMPDGSTHEMRAGDDVIDCGDQTTGCVTDRTGTYLSVDGTKMRFEKTSSTEVLYMPDGSKYVFGTPGSGDGSFIDRNGNQMDYDYSSKQWTDTLGRTIVDPLPANLTETQTQTVGDTTATFPGLGGGTISATFSWRYLKDPGAGESGLDDPGSTTLAYASNQWCAASTTHVNSGTTLFNGNGDTRICGDSTQFNPIVLTKITLANGQSYQFKYNIYGEIDKIIYPAGGYERFAYGQLPMIQSNLNPDYDQTNRGVSDRWISAKGDGTDEIHWTYGATAATNSPAAPYTVTINAPDGTKTQQYIYSENNFGVQVPEPYGFGNIKTGHSYEDRAYSSGNVLLRRHLTDYTTTDTTTGVSPVSSLTATRDLRPSREISIVFESGATSALATMKETTYDSNGDAQYFAPLNPTIGKRYNYISVDLTTAQTSDSATIGALFSSGDLANSNETDYLYDSNYKARNIAGLPTDTRVKDSSGNIKAKSQIVYDETLTYPIISAGTDTQWTDPSTNYRGNPTTSRSWTDIGFNQYIETHAQYDNFGNLRKYWDGSGNLTETEYNSTYKYAYPTKVTTPVPDSSGTNGSSIAFEMTTTYDLTSGLPLTTTDPNSQTTTMEYSDSLLRLTKIIPPSAGGITEIIYTDTPGSVTVKTRSQIDPTNYAESNVYADGFGRTIKTENKDNAGNVFTETQYDIMGRAYKTSNTYRVGDTVLWTQTAFDDLGRVHTVTTPDSAVLTTDFDISTSGTLATIVTATDQAGKIGRSLTDSLGQLIRVDEPDDSGSLGTLSSPNQPTSYGYDTLNNLTGITQGSQSRTFTYDALSRLKAAVNPESGAIDYVYDNNSNLTSKTDARSIVTTYAYDNLNRLKTRSYSNSTPAVTYYYDGTGLSSTPSYAKSKLTRVSSSVSDTKYTSFDNAGKILLSEQVTDGSTYAFGYTYNLGGALLEEMYPSGRKVKNTIDTDASLSKVETMPSGGSYTTRAESFSYTAAREVSSMKFGNGKWENMAFNNRLQPTQLGLGTSSTDQSLWKVNYDYGTTNNNGNVLSQNITVPTLSAIVQAYAYDSLNRIKDATETVSGSTTWKQTFTYDRYGNRNFDAANTTTIPGGCSTARCNPTIDTANNKFTTTQGYTYDLSGNLLTDAEGRTFVYDAENKQQTVSDSTGTIGTYSYDGDGKRVKKVSATETTLFVYDVSGKLNAEYLLTSATPATPTTSYLTNDTLGSPRVVTDSSGNVISRRDFMPFGEEISGLGGRTSGSGYQIDGLRQKFTGYTRDNESSLNFAETRYLSSNSGRFLSADPYGGNILSPQSLNKYTYVANNPLNFIDPTGLKCDEANKSGDNDPCIWVSNGKGLYESLWQSQFKSGNDLFDNGYQVINPSTVAPFRLNTINNNGANPNNFSDLDDLQGELVTLGANGEFVRHDPGVETVDSTDYNGRWYRDNEGIANQYEHDNPDNYLESQTGLSFFSFVESTDYHYHKPLQRYIGFGIGPSVPNASFSLSVLAAGKTSSGLLLQGSVGHMGLVGSLSSTLIDTNLRPHWPWETLSFTPALGTPQASGQVLLVVPVSPNNNPDPYSTMQRQHYHPGYASHP